MGDSIVDVMESVSSLKISVTCPPVAMNRLGYDWTGTAATLSVVISAPLP